MSIESESFKYSELYHRKQPNKKKLPKIAARYVEVEHFKDSDHHKGYFCYNCVYFVKPHHCAIVTDEGTDILGRSSGVIPPHGSYSLWMPNEKEIYRDSSYRGAGTEASIQSESEESTHGVSASFSCEICSNSFASREELR